MSAIPMSVGTQLSRLGSAQKSGTGVPAYMRWVNRPAGRVIAAFAARAGWTPNTVTLMSAMLSVAGLAVAVSLGPGWGPAIAAALLLALGFAFDSADGQLARLTGAGGPAGEWLDHVVDAVRQPLIHVTVAAMFLVHDGEASWVAVIAGAFAVLTAGQFLSQILAEQLVARHGRGLRERAPGPLMSTPRDLEAAPSRAKSPGVLLSFLILPTDTGVLCWLFVFWGAPAAFATAYVVLFLINVGYAAVSMRRKYVRLATIKREPPSG